MALPTIPATETPDPAGDYARAQAWAMLLAKDQDAGNWASWAALCADAKLTDLAATLGSNTVEADISALTTEIGTIISFVPGTITGGTNAFSDTLLTSVRNRLNSDIAAFSTGLGADVEAAMFTRETNRQNAARAQAYNEAVLQFSSRGYRRPPGALDAKIAEISNQSSLQLSESSGKILEETTRLALDYNKHILSVSTQLVGALAQVFDSQEARAFESSKSTVLASIEAYKAQLAMVTAKADIVLKKGDMVLAAKARQMALEVETLRGVAQSYFQIVSSSLNTIHASTSFGFGGSASTSYQGT